MKTAVENIRSKVEKRQIVQYLLLRERILSNKIKSPTTTSTESIAVCKKRHSEIAKLIEMIKKDTIDKNIREMHKYIHKQNDYQDELKKKSNLPEEAVKGLISACEDVKNGDYKVLEKISDNTKKANEVQND